MFRTIVASAIAIVMLSGAASAATFLIDKDQVTFAKPAVAAVYGSKSVGSIGRTTSAGTLNLAKCDPMPTAYEPYFGFCDAAKANVGSLSERSPIQVPVLISAAVPGVPAQCVYTYKHVSGPIWNPTITTSQTTGAC